MKTHRWHDGGEISVNVGLVSPLSFSGLNSGPSCPLILGTIQITCPLGLKTMVYTCIFGLSTADEQLHYRIEFV